MKQVLLLSLILGFGLYSTESKAQLFRLKTTSYTGVTGFESQWDTALADIETQVNKDFPSTSSPQRLMQGMANSSVMAVKVLALTMLLECKL